MADNKQFGPIDVRMGNNSSIGHIGHKITFSAPPPDPNSIFQAGRAVGVMGTPPQFIDGKYFFEKLFIGGPFDQKSEFQIQGVRLVIDEISATTRVSLGGRPPIATLWNVTCSVI